MKLLCILLGILCCATGLSQTKTVSLVVLGTVQDAGSPHIGCKKECCEALFEQPDPTRKVVSLGVIDHIDQKTYLFDATPDMTEQIKLLQDFAELENEAPNGIFLTHAHIGHYTGLMYLGREALGAKATPVFAMPRMKNFLESNGPWNQLVKLENIILNEMESDKEIRLTASIKIQPISVPHRGEFSETVGFKIYGPNKTVLFIPDIDKWYLWESSIIEEIKKVDVAFLDATFYDAQEINNRDIAEIPHPFVVESLELFKGLPKEEKSKVHFIHLNHTNPLLNAHSEAYQNTIDAGFKVAQFAEQFQL